MAQGAKPDPEGPAEDSESDVPGEADAEIACDRGCDARLPAGILGLGVTPANAACRFVLEPEEKEDEPAAGVDSAILGVLKR